MQESRMNIFEIILLIVGVVAAFLGFKLINELYRINNSQISWLMVIAIFSWLTLMVLLILLSLMVDASKKELSEIKKLIEILSRNKGRK